MSREEFTVETEAVADGSASGRWGAGGDGTGRTQSSSNRSAFSRTKIGIGFNALCVGTLIGVVFAIVLLCIGFIVAYENEGHVVATVDLFIEELPPEQTVWFETNLAELRNAFRVEENKRRARNVVLFVALDSAESSYAEPRPIWESFPHLALLRPTRERSGFASFNPTSMFAGIETRADTIGFDSSVGPWDDCVSSENSGHRAASIVEWAQTVGRRTGLVTNGEIVQAFPAALYGHTTNASWLYATPDPRRCDDLRSQLLQGQTGRQLNVIAGSLRCPGVNCQQSFQDEWERLKVAEGSSYRLSEEVSDLLDLHDDPEYVLGMYDQQALTRPNAFRDLTLGALDVLDSPEGFLLIAFADPTVRLPSREIDAAVRNTLRRLSDDLEDSLIVVIRSDVGDLRSPVATVHATGPMAHLLHRVHNQTFLAHFVSYAARIGRFRDADLTNFLLKIF